MFHLMLTASLPIYASQSRAVRYTLAGRVTDRANQVVTEGIAMLRHVAFFEELGKLDECNPDWRSVSAGLVVMRLVDRWVEDGIVATDGWGASAVRESVASIPATTPLQRILASIVERISGATRVDMRALTPRLMAYGQALEYDAKWHLAIDVYETIINHADPV